MMMPMKILKPVNPTVVHVLSRPTLVDIVSSFSIREMLRFISV